MKTNYYFKLFAIYLLIFFSGCQKETVLDVEESTLIEQDNSFSITENSFEDAFQEDVFKSTYLKYEEIKKNAEELYTGKTDPELYNFTIDKSNVKAVKFGDFISYTIPIHRKIVSVDYFENLVLQTNTDGNVSAFLIKYNHNKAIKVLEEHNSFQMNGAYKTTRLDTSKIKLTGNGCGGTYQAWCSHEYHHLAGEQCFIHNLDKITIKYVQNDCEFGETEFTPPIGAGSGGGLFLNSLNGLVLGGDSSIQISDPFIVPTLPDGTVVNFEEDMARTLADKLNITDIDQINYLIDNFSVVLQLDTFLESNDTPEGREFLKFAIEKLAKDPDDELNNFLVSLNLFQDTEVNFDTLLDNFENIKGSHFDSNTKKEIFSNYCAINLSHALLKSGIKIDSKKVTTCWGCEDKTYKNKHAIRAQELADWLVKSSIDGVSKVKVLTGENFEDYVSGKKGIIFFKDYWQRDSDSGTNRTGDHIDLWNGNALVSSSWFGTWFRLTFPELSETFGSSDLSKSKEVLFWEIK